MRGKTNVRLLERRDPKEKQFFGERVLKGIRVLSAVRLLEYIMMILYVFAKEHIFYLNPVERRRR